MDIPSALSIPAFAVCLYIIFRQEIRLTAKDKTLVEMISLFANFTAKFEKQATLLETLVHRDGGGGGAS